MSVVTATIKSEGKALPQQYELLSVEVNQEVNRIPFAELTLLDGDAARREFTLSDEPFFEPGKEIEIQLRYEGEKGPSSTIFKGLVIRHNLEANSVDSLLTIELQDKAYGMTLGKYNRIFQNRSDQQIIEELISKGGAAVGKVPKTQPKQEEIVQYYCSNWDFILVRAQVNNLLVSVDQGKISLHEIEIASKAKHKFEYGLSEMYGFEMEADAGHQYQSVSSVSWNIKSQKLTQKKLAKDISLQQGNLDAASIAKKIGGTDLRLYSNVALAPEETQNWADSMMARARLSLLKGVITVRGNAKIQLLDTIEIGGIGKRFNGKTLVTGIRHSVNHDGWKTHVQLGLSVKTHAQKFNTSALSAAGLLPSIQGLQIGLVDAFEKDSKGGHFRIRVAVPGLEEGSGKIWARLLSPDAGKDRGWLFRPEQGDEVVLGFLNNDPRQAVILGSLFSSAKPPPKPWANQEKDNPLKGLMSKTGITIEINDKEKTLRLLTSEKNSILLDEKNKKVLVTDVNNNNITLDRNGISIKASNKLQIEAKGEVNLKTNGNLQLKASNITIDASASLSLKGSTVDVK